MSIFILKFIQETIGFIHKSFVFIHEGYTCIRGSFAHNVCETHLFAKVARLFKKQIFTSKNELNWLLYMVMIWFQREKKCLYTIISPLHRNKIFIKTNLFSDVRFSPFNLYLLKGCWNKQKFLSFPNSTQVSEFSFELPWYMYR